MVLDPALMLVVEVQVITTGNISHVCVPGFSNALVFVAGTHTLVSDVSLEPDEWHRTKQNKNAPPAGGCKKCPISNEEFSNNNWDKPSG